MNKLEIQKYGTDPETFMVSAIQQNRLLAIGEDHVYDGTSQHHRFGSKLMPLLKQKGATHLALEFPSNHQDILDRFMDTGKLDLSLLESSKGSNEFLASKGFCESKDLIPILESARKSGLKLIAVDDADSINQGAFSAIFGASRDKAIAKNLAGVLNADKKHKVVFWAGAIHAQVTADKRDSERASQILRNQGVNVLSVLPKDYETMSDNEPVRELFREVSRPVLVPMMKAKEFSKLPELKTIYPGQQNFNAWDAVILYPPAK